MGLKSPVRSPVDVLLLSRSETLAEALDEINFGLVKDRGEEDGVQYGYPRNAFRDMNSHVRVRLSKHLRRRSQRAYKVSKGKSVDEYLNELGLITL